MFEEMREQVRMCTICGENFRGMGAVGIGKEQDPSIFFIGMNPWVHPNTGEFRNGRGLTKLLEYLNRWRITNWFLDNVIKCQMPGKFRPGKKHAENCKPYLMNQLKAFPDAKIIVFGQFAAESMNIQYIPWNDNKYIATVPHFSSIFYPSGLDEKEYYKRMRAIVKVNPKQLNLFGGSYADLHKPHGNDKRS
ncbi:MAG: hypothetical protein RBS96_02555 [Dehalococcoidales bacterium]|jgi:uracil-DNA glycosylase family 4|nr:hypothetical protein [Dehalococcoidales bacterium]